MRAMHGRLSVLIALVLAIAPHLGAAEGLLGAGLITPLHPPLHDFVSLFQSPALRIIPDPLSPQPPNPSTMPVASRPGLPVLAGTIASGAMCRPALAAAEARYGIPIGLMQAIGVVESGRRDEVTGARRPWPWTINAEGEPHVFDTKEQAVAWVRQAQARGTRSIDIGCAQVNLMHHPSAFTSLEEAFNPATNADYAARFLKELRDTAAGGNWMTAVGYYHSQTPELAEAYRQQVQAVTSRGAVPMPSVPATALTVYPASPFGSTGRQLPTGGARPELTRLLAAPAGTVGRGLDGYRATPIQMAGPAGPGPLTMQR
jgi:Transglycosylase SLT domain